MTQSRRLHKWRLLVLVGLGLFGLSITLLLTASGSPRRIQPWTLTWEGAIDVTLAFAVAIISILIYGKAKNRVGNSEWQISYKVATALPVAMLLTMWAFADKIRWWNVLLPGLAWRTWLLLYTLPAVLAIWKNVEARQETAQ